MRCFLCESLLVVPTPKPGEAEGLHIVQLVDCNRCGAQYQINTTLVRGRTKMADRRRTDAEREKARVWGGSED